MSQLTVGDTPFASLFADAVTRCGVDEFTLADALGVAPMSVRFWWTGRTRPAMQRLTQLSELLDLPLASVCEAAGKPINEVLRAAFSASPERSLPHVLRSWRDGEGIDNRQAAALIGVRVEQFARMQCGSCQPGKVVLTRMADTLPFTLVELTDAAWPGDDDANAAMRRWARCLSRPTAVMIRRARTRLAVGLSAVEATTGLGPCVLAELESGERVPNPDECIALARGLQLDLLALLLSAGVATVTAAEIATAVAATAGRRRNGGRRLIEQLRSKPYIDPGGARRAVTGWDELSRRTGISRFRIMKVTRDTYGNGFTAVECIALADALDAPRERLLAGFGHHV